MSFHRFIGDDNFLTTQRKNAFARDDIPGREGLIRLVAIEEQVKKQFEAVNAGRVLQTLLTVLPIVITVLSCTGGFYTVYASTDCQGTEFKKYCRGFLYTSITATLVSVVVEKLITHNIRFLMQRPTLAFYSFCGQAVLLVAFCVTMAVLLGFVVKNACSSVKSKVLF